MNSVMKALAIAGFAIVLSGCGSKSGTPEASVAGVPLAIKSPAAAEVSDAASQPQKSAQTPSSKAVAEERATDPDVEVLIQRAQAAVGARRNSSAIEALSQAIGIAPNNPRLFRLRADVYSLMGEYANARADFSLAIQTDSQSADLYNARGYFLMTRGLSQEAFEDFQKALELDPQMAIAFNNRGLIELSNEEYETAIQSFSSALKLDSDYVDALNNRGFARMKLGQLDAALVDLQRTVQLNPDYTTAWNNCGLLYMQQEKFSEAVDAFSEAVRLAPLDARWLNHRRTALQKLEDFEAANADAQRIRWLSSLSELTSVVNAKPNDPNAWLQRAAHLSKGSEFAAAVQDYTRTLNLQPNHPEALTGRAEALLQIGDAQNALIDCDTAINLGGSSTAYAIRANAWFAVADYDNAIRDFEAAQTLNQTLAQAYEKRAEQRTAAGETQLAELDRQKAQHILDALAGRLEQKPTAELVDFPTAE